VEGCLANHHAEVASSAPARLMGIPGSDPQHPSSASIVAAAPQPSTSLNSNAFQTCAGPKNARDLSDRGRRGGAVNYLPVPSQTPPNVGEPWKLCGAGAADDLSARPQAGFLPFSQNWLYPPSTTKISTDPDGPLPARYGVTVAEK
jgi:hypothetical protein